MDAHGRVGRRRARRERPRVSLPALTFVVVATALTALWLMSLVIRDVSIVDVFWGPGFVLVASLAAWLGEGPASRRLLVWMLTTVWGVRLGLHLLHRNWGAGEDYRYAAMRRAWGGRFWWASLFQVFWLQAVILWVVSWPVQAAAVSPSPPALGATDALGVLVWLIGFLFEAVGDAQLRRFKGDPSQRGLVMDRGLRHATRHPNYFGDATMWWGLWLIAAPTPWGPWVAVSPIVMTFFLMRVSGVPMLERHLMRTRPGFADYVERTSAFFPRPPRA